MPPIDDTGDKTETQAPDVAPEPETAPVGRRPASGDALLAAGFSQFCQNVLNQLHWLKNPFAKATALAAHILAFRNSNQHKGAGFDHQGLLAGRFATWQENWVDVAAVQKIIAGSGAWFGKWNYGVFNAVAGNGACYANGAWGNLTTHPWGSILGLQAGNASPANGSLSAAVAEMCVPIVTVSDAVSILEAAFSPNVPSGGLVSAWTAAWGFGGGGWISGASTDAINTGAAVPNGSAYFCREAGGTVWRCTSRTPGGSAIHTNTAVAVTADTAVRGRIEVVGAGASDDATARVLFYLGGALVANHAHSLVNAPLSPFARSANGNAGLNLLNIGPMRFTTRLELGDQPLI